MTKKKPPQNPLYQSVNRADLFQSENVVNLNKVRKQSDKEQKQRRNKGDISVLNYELNKQQTNRHQGLKLDTEDKNKNPLE